MTTNAGEMQTAATGGPQWVLANGAPYYCLYAGQPQRTKGVLSEGNRQDYIRRVGWQGRRRGLGPLGWIICMPVTTSTYYVSTADDSTETTLTTPPTVAKPPPGTK
jgi:hypothetical protein